jgi:hypothetical protein
MKQNLKQNHPVLTADAYHLGQAHTLYHRQEPARNRSVGIPHEGAARPVRGRSLGFFTFGGHFDPQK